MAYLGRQPNTGVRSRFIYTATASQDTFSGADADGKTLKYEDAAYVDVFLNGVLLKPVTDYAATTKTSIVLASVAASGDILEIVAYDIANIADTVSKANGGTFEAGVTVNGTVTADGLTVDTDTLYVDSANNSVGIGTSTPNTYGKIVVDDGKISLVTDIASSRRLSFWSTANGNSENAYIQAQNDGATTNTGEILFATKNTGGTLAERVRIDASGNLGIGTNDPSSYGKVGIINPSSVSDGVRVQNGNTSIVSRNIWSTYTSNNNNTTAIHFAAYDGAVGADVFRVYGNGNVVNQNNSYGSTSDEKLKENIVDSGSQWDDIKALRVRKYSMKEDALDAPNKLGVIAQEVEAAGMSGLVFETPDFDFETKEDLGTVTKQVNYSVLYMKAVKALQEAMERIEALETENVVIKARLAALENA